MWDVIVQWVREHLGQEVMMSLTASEADGYTCATVVTTGRLGYADADWAVAEPPPGPSLSCRVGDAGLILFEGTVEDAERLGADLTVSMTVGELALSPAG